MADATQQSLVAVAQGDMSHTDVIPEFGLGEVTFPVKLFYLLRATGLCATSSEARRQISGGAVKLNGLKVEAVEQSIAEAEELLGQVLQVGKKRFVRFIP